MKLAAQSLPSTRYSKVSQEKFHGATYTPEILAEFVAEKIVESLNTKTLTPPIRVLDPAVGEGQLLMSLVSRLRLAGDFPIEIYGFETDPQALEMAEHRLKQEFENISVKFELANFLDFVLSQDMTLFGPPERTEYDLVIANPPYVRTQILGANKARSIARQFGLSGRVDLYYPFVLGIAQVLKPTGIAGIIVSNRFMTTRAGASLRSRIKQDTTIRHLWDLGDTKLFDAAVLPAVLLLEGKSNHQSGTTRFTTIYETTAPARDHADNPIAALAKQGIVEVRDGRRFEVLHGILDASGSPDDVWRISTQQKDTWLETVQRNRWGTFGDIGKIRVGVKTCADRVFIRSDWQEMPPDERPELLKPLVTHHIARRFRSVEPQRPRQILYPHESIHGKRRAVDLTKYPRSQSYLEKHREVLEGRRYVVESGREWYEIWVPQDPSVWSLPKLVFRDISEKPVFWVELDSVVNGDCYWLIAKSHDDTDLLWLAAAVGNSTFIEKFYDNYFQNKLYAGRRRFMTQYVEKFPLPDPKGIMGRSIVATAKEIYYSIGRKEHTLELEKRLDALVWQSFGLVVEEVGR